jgi:xanthine dehydrogenase accessory factor
MKEMPRDWLPAVAEFLKREPVVARIVVAEVRGSAPRDAGAFMLVGRGGVAGTIGGGKLEWDCIAAARELLEDCAVAARFNRVVLGADLGQCCGGVVAVWLERFTRDDLGFLRAASDAGARGSAVLSSTIRGAGAERQLVCGMGVSQAADRLLRAPRLHARPQVIRDAAGDLVFLERLDDELPALWLYGAGHVGQALSRILMELPVRLTWIDARAELFPASLAEGVRIRRDPDSLGTVSEAPVGAYYLVMTHSHPLDYALCRAILQRNDFAWLGLIGSSSKAARFRSRLRRDAIGAEAIARLVCPIGIDGIESKWPAAIAVGVAAQVMQQISATAVVRAGAPGVVAEWSPPRDGVACASESCASCGSSVGRADTDARADVPAGSAAAAARLDVATRPDRPVGADAVGARSGGPSAATVTGS